MYIYVYINTHLCLGVGNMMGTCWKYHGKLVVLELGMLGIDHRGRPGPFQCVKMGSQEELAMQKAKIWMYKILGYYRLLIPKILDV